MNTWPIKSTVRDAYEGSDANLTRAVYARLKERGPVGDVAVNLLRAHKASTRAKVYRGGVPGRGSYRGMAYDKKNWSINQLCAALIEHGQALQIPFGWKRDPGAVGPHAWVLYVDLPTGQVSFHSDQHGPGPDYAGDWDGMRNKSAPRIINWAQGLLDAPAATAHDKSADQMIWCGEASQFLRRSEDDV